MELANERDMGQVIDAVITRNQGVPKSLTSTVRSWEMMLIRM